MLLTPVMRAGLRRSPIVAMLVPLVVVGLDAWLSWGLSESGGTGPALMDFCTYATCWMFGMAHRDGSLGRVHKVLLAVLAVAALAGGAVWTRLHVPSLDIDEVPLAAALISAGVVIPLLSASPGMRWLDKIPVLRGLLGLVTGRALTIYLLYPVAVAAAPLVIARLGVRADARTLIVATVGLTVLGVLLFGWVEDLAARRPLGVYPRYRRKKRKSKSFDTRAVPLGAPVLAVSEPVPVPQQAGPRQPVLQGAGPPRCTPPVRTARSGDGRTGHAGPRPHPAAGGPGRPAACRRRRRTPGPRRIARGRRTPARNTPACCTRARSPTCRTRAPAGAAALRPASRPAAPGLAALRTAAAAAPGPLPPRPPRRGAPHAARTADRPRPAQHSGEHPAPAALRPARGPASARAERRAAARDAATRPAAPGPAPAATTAATTATTATTARPAIGEAPLRTRTTRAMACVVAALALALAACSSTGTPNPAPGRRRPT